MSDLTRYVEKRLENDAEFADGFEVGYAHFKIGVLLRQAREAAGMYRGRTRPWGMTFYWKSDKGKR